MILSALGPKIFQSPSTCTATSPSSAPVHGGGLASGSAVAVMTALLGLRVSPGGWRGLPSPWRYHGTSSGGSGVLPAIRSAAFSATIITGA